MNDLTMHLVPGAFRRMYLSAFWRVRLAAPRFMLSAAALDNLALRPVAGATPRAAFPFSGNGQDRSGGDAHGAEIPRLVVAIDEDGEARSPEPHGQAAAIRSEEHTSELQSLMRISYAVFCLKKKKKQKQRTRTH